ncbi:MAG: 2-oxoacid:acceptor oxidoreductase subunit alpha [Deltaproteobacteria bacterium]
MTTVDLTIEICGMSGDGTIAAGALLNAAMARQGFSVLAFDSYPAEIRGFGRCVTRSRIGDQERLALSAKTHVLISLDDEQSQSRLPGLAEGATVFFDNRPPVLLPEGMSLAAHVTPDTELIGVPFTALASRAAGSARGKNIAALGGLAALFGMDPEPFRQVIEGKFKAKGEAVLAGNLKSFDLAYEYVLENYRERRRADLTAPAATSKDRQLLSGNQAIVRAALDAGLKLYFGYPITPATPVMELLAKALPENGGRVVQMEDEISSIGAVLGSFYAGTRAMTATSGPGFALMTELITHGVMAEIPAVIVDAQRGGPATGLPTKTEQSDLLAAVFGGPGDSSRLVLAPTNVAECYQLLVKSFQLAEKYQTPVILLTEFFLHNRVETVGQLSATDEEKACGNIFPDPAARDAYERYALTESGISPRPLPGTEGFIHTVTGLEHTPKGFSDFSPANHQAMSDKRHRKMVTALADMPLPQALPESGELEVGVIAWGSSWGAALEAVNMAREKGLSVGALRVTSIFPYHEEEIRSFMARCREVLFPELNHDGQLATLIGHLHGSGVRRLNRVTGLPLTAVEILDGIEEILGKS